VSETKMNKSSSRSHCLFSITVHTVEANGKKRKKNYERRKKRMEKRRFFSSPFSKSHLHACIPLIKHMQNYNETNNIYIYCNLSF
jgi:hypothetical protein